MPASIASLTSNRQVNGASSAGLITIVLPIAIAGPASFTVLGPGAFQGMMLPHTPNGSRSVIPITSGNMLGKVTPVALSARPAVKVRIPDIGPAAPAGPHFGR